jgi:hypothetical protein
VTVTAIKNIRINIDELNEIPTNGTSLDHWVQVDYAPDLGVEVILKPMTKMAYLSTTSVFLASGWNNVSFRVFNNATEEALLKGN